MSRGRRAAAVLLGGWLVVASGCAIPPPREVLLLARGMAFILPDQPDTSNPVIPFRAGEHVRVVFRNEAPGLIHDFHVPAWNVVTEAIRAGETTDVVFTVPPTPGRFEYLCRPHAELMRGFVEVTP